MKFRTGLLVIILGSLLQGIQWAIRELEGLLRK